MKALVLQEYNHLVYTDVPRPEVGEEEVLIEVKACGICGSDVHGMDGSTGRRRPPIIMGHEAAGVIAEVGRGVTGWKPGDRVTFDSTVYCGECAFCKSGQINLCDNRRVLGVSCAEYRQHGAFAEYATAPSRILYRLPEALSFERAAMTEPVSIAVHAVKLTQVKPGDTAAVVGTGMIGLFVVQALRVAGCENIIAVDIDPDKLTLARSLGAAHTVNAGETDAVRTIRELTGGLGADIALEVVGSTPTVKAGVECLRKGGTLVLVGNLSPTVELPLQSVVTREIRLQGSCASCGDYPECLDLIGSGKINVDYMLSAVAPLQEGADWFQRLYTHEKGLMKVVLTPE